MENLPRISVLSLPLKNSGDPPDLSPMAKDIERHYQQNADMYKKEFAEFQIARKAACEPSIDYTGISKLKRYFAQLQLAKGRFHFSVDENTAVLWTWFDAFSNSLFESVDIGFEEAAILFNISALHTILGSRERRVEADSMKVACTHFQCAVWALETFAERHSAEATGDLNTELIRVLGSLMTAQAQECIVEKSILDGRPANITAKLTQYLTETYEQVATRLTTPAVIASFPPKYQKDWRRRCLIKSSYYAALVAYFAGLCEEGDKKYGRAIAWFQLAQKRIAEAEKVSKELKESDTTSVPLVHGGPLRVNVQFVADAIQTKVTGLVKDNDFIYHEVVPAAESLEPIKAACLVKGVPFDSNDPEIRGPDIFQRLVPMKTLEAASVYSEHKAALLRSIASEVDDKESAIELFLTSIDICPETMMQPDPPLPQELFDACKRIAALEHGPERDLSNHMQKLAKESTDVETEAQQLIELIGDLKIRLDALSAVKSNDQIKSIQNSVTSLGERCQGLNSTIQLARNSNLKLREILGMHLNTLKRLTTPTDELFAKLPSVKPILEDESVKRIMTEATRLFAKVDEMRRQRVDLITQLRQTLHQDDITGDLLTGSMDPTDLDEMFKARLKKHDPLVGLLRQNLTAQDNIESALIDLNAEFAPNATKLREVRQKRTDEIQELMLSGQAYVDVVDKCQEGLKFYAEMTRRLADLQTELEQVAARLTSEESRPTNIAPPRATSVTASSLPSGSGVPWTASSTQATHQPGLVPPMVRPGQIPTLGDYMASMRQRSLDQQGAMATGGPRSMLPSWPNPAVTMMQNFPRMAPQPVVATVGQPNAGGPCATPSSQSAGVAPPMQRFMPPQTSSSTFTQPPVFMTNRPSANTMGAAPYSSAVPYQHPGTTAPYYQSVQPAPSQPPPPMGLRPMPPTSYPVPGQNQPGHSVLQPNQPGHPISQPNQSGHPAPQPNQPGLPAPQPNQPPFATSRPSTMPMTGPQPGQDLPRSGQPQAAQMPYTRYSVPSAYPGPAQMAPGWPTQPNNAPGFPGQTSSLLARPPTPGLQPPTGTYGQQPVTTQYPIVSEPQTMFRQPAPPPGEFHTSVLAQPRMSGQSERPPVSGSGYAPVYHYPTPTNPVQGQRLPFTGQPAPPQTIGPTMGSTFPTMGTAHPTMAVRPNPVPSQYPAPGGPQFTSSSNPSMISPQTPNVMPPRPYSMPPVPSTYPAVAQSAHGPYPSAFTAHPSGPVGHLPPGSIEANATGIGTGTATATTSNNAAPATTAAPNAPDSAPLQPHVLTMADLDAQRREERLRATYSNSPQPLIPGPTVCVESGQVAQPSRVTDPRRSSHESSDPLISHTLGTTDQRNKGSASGTGGNKDHSSTNSSVAQTDPLSDPLVLNPFIAATENLLTWLEHLMEPVIEDSKPGLATRLDKAWTRVQAIANERPSSGKKPTQAAAMCCPSKNRRQDCVPYDANRVVLENSKNDYINASHIDFLGHFGEWCPRYIVAQAPMHKTVADFWHMILSQGCEVVVFLPPPPVRSSRPSSPGLAGLTDWNSTGAGDYGDPTNPLAIPQHLPANKVGSRFPVPGSHPSLELRLQALKTSDQASRPDESNRSGAHGFTERILTVRNTATEQTRSLVHLTYNGPMLRPTNPPTACSGGGGGSTDQGIDAFCAFVNHVHTYYKQQRNLLRPIAVVCEYGAGLSGIFVTASVALLHAERLGRVADLIEVAGRLLQQRRAVLSQPDELAIAGRVVAHAAVEAVAKRDVVVGPRRRTSNCTTGRTADTVSNRSSAHNEASNPVDTLFSDRPLQLSELMSVVDRWNIGTTATDAPTEMNGHNTATKPLTTQAVEHEELATPVAPDGVHDSLNGLSSDVDAGKPPAATDHAPDATLELDRLVDLSTLGATNPSGRRRYNRRDFESGTRPPPGVTDDSTDPFDQLDPFHALTDCTDSPVS